LPQFDVPVLFLSTVSKANFPSVSIDNYRGGCIATQHLLDQGFQKIGHLAGPLNWLDARLRRDGWKDTLIKSRIPVNDHHWVDGNWTASSGYVAGQKLLKQYPDMEAVFIANDQMTLGFLKCVQDQHLSIPEDIAVVGFDGTPEAEYYIPPLTTVCQDLNQLGCKAVETLIEIIERREQDVHERAGAGELLIVSDSNILQPQIIIRESSVLEQRSPVVES
jgi:LacI family transcriptional regulator